MEKSLSLFTKRSSPKQLKKDIIDGKSMTLLYPEYKIYTSAIVAGVIPIALGTALSLKETERMKRFIFSWVV